MIESLEGRQLMSGTTFIGPTIPAGTSAPQLNVPLSAALTTIFSGSDVNSTSGGSVAISDGTDYDLTAGGIDISGAADSFRFQNTSVTGDFDIRVKVNGLSKGGGKTKAGLMARESLAAGSRNVFAGVTGADGARFTYRTGTGGSTTINKPAGGTAPMYLRLKRIGNIFTGYQSANGTSWTKTGTITVKMPTTIQVGMAVAGDSTTVAAAASFRGFNQTGTVAPAPASATSIRWTNGPDAPYTDQESITIQVGNKMFMWGGFIDNDHNISEQGWFLNLDDKTWTRVADTPQTQSHTAIATDGTRYIYFAGGIDDTGHRVSTANCYRYDIEKNVFTSFPALPSIRIGGGLAYANSELHFFGGDIDDRVTPSDKHWAIKLDAAGNAAGPWTVRAPMLRPSDHHSAMVLNGKIYAVGGEHGHSTTYVQHDTLSEYDPVMDTWRALAPLPRASSHFEGGTLIVNGRIVVMGGQGADEKMINDVKVYDPATNTWSVLNDMPGVRKGGAGAFYKGELYYSTGRGLSPGGSRVNFKNTWIGKIENAW